MQQHLLIAKKIGVEGENSPAVKNGSARHVQQCTQHEMQKPAKDGS